VAKNEILVSESKDRKFDKEKFISMIFSQFRRKFR